MEEKELEVQENTEETLSKQDEEIRKRFDGAFINADDKNVGKGDEDYTSSNLKVMKGLEHIRLRPGMYIGDTGNKGFHHLVWELVDNAVDEAIAGFCTEIDVTLNKDGSLTVKDNGRGVPVDKMPGSELTGVETVFTVLNAGGKFGGKSVYKVSGGLHGVGAKAVNALSSSMDVIVERDGGKYFMHCEKGKCIEHLHRIGDSENRGTTVTFKPDPEIFPSVERFNFDMIESRLRQTAFLIKGVTINLVDNRLDEPQSTIFCFKEGIKDYVRYINRGKTVLTQDILYFNGAQRFKKIDDTETDIVVEFAMQYNDGFNTDDIYSYCNNVKTPGGGTHYDGFINALVRVFNSYARANKFLTEKDNERIKAQDCKSGLVAVISVKHENPEYEGQVKDKLGNPEVKEITSSIVGAILERYLNENKDIASQILTKIVQIYHARIKAAKIFEEEKKKNGLEITTLPGKLADCSSANPEECELFIVEGNSAGGSAKQGRDPKIQAILPLRGKILNVLKASDDQIMANAEIGNMIKAIGGGYGENFDVSKIRYHKIVIMTDADVDGSHIRLLLLTFFNRFMKPLIDGGYIYIAQPPLYKVEYKNKDYYAYSDEQLEVIRKQLQLKTGYPFQRYKGLGEMDPEQLEETTMDPNVRKMLRVTIEDAYLAEELISELMGEDVEPRYDYITKNAQFVKNLDI